jgi:hypothetical protein
VVRELNGDCFVEGDEACGSTIAGKYKREILSDEKYPKKLADAQLVAASPKMLDILERIVAEADGRKKRDSKELLAWIRIWAKDGIQAAQGESEKEINK